MADSQQTTEEIVTGSCLCKAIKYKATGKPVFTTICHCYNCRKSGGGPMAGSSIYPRAQVDIISGQDQIKVYNDAATDSGTSFDRQFCQNCGCQMFGSTKLAEQILAVYVGSLDPEYVNKWTPTNEQYCQTKAEFIPKLVEAGKGGRFVRSMMGPQVE
ncbi:carbon-sulfur lyase-like protein [Elsinoe australis]|uniref:Carbon-sulfur lyase-like protein n=1 Tax=Elsinoe australis TaxID=40998 RepID=A0A4U7B8H6_9PEZI|nr:carbon-sulfur lyase-like protein [Elsinoe australis]